jgi:hypothetical protein
VFWFWFFVGPALILAFLSLRGERKRARYVAARLDEPAPARLPPATVVVPVKGHDDGLRENLAALAELDYPDYELIVVAHAARDIPAGVLPPSAKIVLAHGRDPVAAEKVQNLMAAVRSARKRSEVLAFADSDGRVSPGWLRALVAPLADEGVGASTGYRWYTPQPPTFWSLVRSVWNGVIAGTMGPGEARFAWGGAMALRKETFFSAHVPDFWKQAISDDYALSAAIREAGLRIVYAPGALVACPDRTSAREFFSWARRQMLITRVYYPRLWWEALIAHVFYCGAMAAAVSVIAAGNHWAEWALVAQLSPGLLKGANRATLAKAALPAWRPWFDRHGWVHTWWVPLVTWVWLVVLLISAVGRTIEWRGRRYAVPAPGGEGQGRVRASVR